MQGKGRKAPLIAMVVAAVLLLALVAAGGMLRMRMQGVDFFTGIASFLKDTFGLYSQG